MWFSSVDAPPVAATVYGERNRPRILDVRSSTRLRARDILSRVHS
jgi:hypothetical protein